MCTITVRFVSSGYQIELTALGELRDQFYIRTQYRNSSVVLRKKSVRNETVAKVPLKKRRPITIQKLSQRRYTEALSKFFSFNWTSKSLKIFNKYNISTSELKPDIIPVFQYKTDWERKFDAIRSDMIKNNTW